MTLLIHDVVSNSDASSLTVYSRGDLADIVYADDTLLLASSNVHLQEFLAKRAEAGQLPGMELHWDKCQLLQVPCQSSILSPSGDRIEPKRGIDCLGMKWDDRG